eukprot:scaffold1727_cov133-Cylindrotheca_fusiformis.AAC.27
MTSSCRVPWNGGTRTPDRRADFHPFVSRDSRIVDITCPLPGVPGKSLARQSHFSQSAMSQPMIEGAYV